MANLKEQEKWEDGIYQIEENDPVLGGADGITNKPIIQLANRTTWLKKALELLTGKSKPKDLTADSTSVADSEGHSHALPKSSTNQQGIVQLDDTWESDSREKAPTARVIKAMKQLIDSLTRNLSNYIPNSKKSNATNSTSSDTLATSLAVKTAYDKGVEAKTAADNAQRTANDGVNKANAAQTAANNAQRTANDGVNKANAAQTAANNAQRTANYGVNKANAAKTAADNAQRTASAKQSPATTLAGYGITDFVVKGEPSTTNARDLNADGIYAFGSGGINLPTNGAFKVVNLGGGSTAWRHQLAMKAYSTEVYLSSQESANSSNWLPWVRIDGQDRVLKSGDTMTGNLAIDTADSLLKGKRNGTNKYAVGLRNSSSDDAVFINYTYDTVLELLRDSVRSNKTLIAAGVIVENSDYAGVSLKNLSNRYVRIEGNPHSAANMLTFVYREANGSNINVVSLPKKSGTLLLDNDLVGEVGFFARATPPSGWLKANGAAVSRTTYAALFAAIGTTFGAGDGRTTFNLPDLRGEFLRGLDDGRNIDPNRRLGSWQKGTIEGFDGLDATSVFGVGLVRDGAWNTLTLEESVTLVGADHTTYDDVREIALKWVGGGGARATNNSADREGGFWTKNNKNPVKSSHFAGMTRPRNIALLACIKY